MLTTEQAEKIVDEFAVLAASVQGSPPVALAQLTRARDQLVAALTGSSRIERAVDPNTDTQLVEAINPDESERAKLLIEGKLLLLDDLLLRHRKLHETLVRYVGCTPEKLHIRSRDLLFMVVDVGLLMRVASGPWLDVVDQIEEDERERRAQTLFAARSTENLAPEMLKAQKAKAEASTTEGQPDGSNG